MSAEFCEDEYYIDVTLPNQARWDMCWEHRSREGIVLHKVHYTPRTGERRMVFNEAAVAQIHVPYDDNGTRYHDVTDYGLGNRYITNLKPEDCPDGNLLRQSSKHLICQQLISRDDAYRYGDDQLQGDALSLFSVSGIGAYNYIPTWRFTDDGSVEPAIGATGALQRYGDSSKENHGWLISDNKVGVAHLHNFFWKLDFDLAGSANNDYVEEINFRQNNGRKLREMTRYHQEAASDVNPQTLRRWRVVDGDITNNKGQPISYEIRLHQANHRDTGPDSEPFTQHDLYVTRYKRCELFASHNPTSGNCADNLAAFVNGENLNGEDIIVWPSTTFYHMPRTEDTPHMDTHWSAISIKPRDWHDRHPLSDSADTGNNSIDHTDDGGSGDDTANDTGNTGNNNNDTTGDDNVDNNVTTDTTDSSPDILTINNTHRTGGGGSLPSGLLVFVAILLLVRFRKPKHSAIPQSTDT